MNRIKTNPLALTFILAAFGLAAYAAPKASPGGIRFVPEKREWAAGSIQKVYVDGRATAGAKSATYVWRTSTGRIVANGNFEKRAKGGFDAKIQVPRFAMKGSLALHLQIDKSAPAESWTFRSGKEFSIPSIKGLIQDANGPALLGHSVEKFKGQYALRTAIADSSGIMESMIVYKDGKKTALANGKCTSEKDTSSCAFFTATDPIRNDARIVLVDNAGNRSVTKVSSRKGVLR